MTSSGVSLESMKARAMVPARPSRAGRLMEPPPRAVRRRGRRPPRSTTFSPPERPDGRHLSRRPAPGRSGPGAAGRCRTRRRTRPRAGRDGGPRRRERSPRRFGRRRATPGRNWPDRSPVRREIELHQARPRRVVGGRLDLGDASLERSGRGARCGRASGRPTASPSLAVSGTWASKRKRRAALQGEERLRPGWPFLRRWRAWR